MEHLEESFLIAFVLVAFMHSLIPSHWLCFSLIGRKFRWKPSRLLLIVTVSNTIHTFFLFLVTIAFRQLVPVVIDSLGSAILIILLGIFYILLHFFRLGHSHSHEKAIERGSVWLLVLSLIVSPCNYVLGLIASVSKIGVWSIIIALMVLFLVSTFTMGLLSYLSFLGLKALKLDWFDRNEKWIIGMIMAGLGILLLLFNDVDHLLY